MFRKLNPASGVPIYVQLREQILHAIETGALSSGSQLPGIRALAESLVINPNTVIRVYHELEQEGVLEVRHGLGAFVASHRSNKSRAKNIIIARELMGTLLEKLKELNLVESEIRRLFEAELMHEPAAQRR